MRPGIRAGDKILLLSQPGKDELAKLDVPDQRIRGFDEELRNASRRRQSRTSSSPPTGENSLCSPVTSLYGGTTSPLLRCLECAGQYTFHGYEAWNVPSLHPPPAEALKLLHSLAADRGIVLLMTQHRQATCMHPNKAFTLPRCSLPSFQQLSSTGPVKHLLRVLLAYRWSVGKLSEMPPEGKVGVSPVCILGVNIGAGQEISLRLRTDDLRGFRRYDRIRETLIHELAHMVFSEHDNHFKELNSQLLREAAAQDWARSARALAGEASSFHEDWESHSANAHSASVPVIHRLGGASPGSSDAQAAAAQAALERAHAQAASASPVPELRTVGPSGAPGHQMDSIEGLGHCDGSTEALEDEMRRLGTPTAQQGSRTGPFTQDHTDYGGAQNSNCPEGSALPESTHPNAAQESTADAANSSASPVEQAVHGIVSAGAPATAKAALDSVMKIIQVGAPSHLCPCSPRCLRSRSSIRSAGLGKDTMRLSCT